MKTTPFLFLLIGLGLAACSADPAYTVTLDAAPAAPIPGQPVLLSFEIDVDGTPEVGATVTGTIQGASPIDLGALTGQGDGRYEAAVTTIPTEGAWTVGLTVQGSLGGTQAVTMQLNLSCATTGAVGELCCAADACESGLSCVFGLCQPALAPVSSACFGDAECADGVCEAGACAAPTCDDGVTNGAETDVDCGGGTCGTCLVGATCSADSDCGSRKCSEGLCIRTLPILGWGTHDFNNVTLKVTGDATNGLSTPRDLAFNPIKPGELWVASTATETMTVFTATATAAQTHRKFNSAGSAHFFARPSALAFGVPGIVGTIHETDELTQGPGATPGDFMGPTTHGTDLKTFDAGHGSHMDMLHNSPLGMGIAWDQGSVFWIFDGYHNSLTRYDFGLDHGPGGADHSDGIVWRYVEGQVARAPGIPSHMEMDHETKLLYVCDTGNHRIGVLDTLTGAMGPNIFPNYDNPGGNNQNYMNDAVVTTLVDGGAINMVSPSGMAMDGDILYVTDNATSRIWAFDKDTGAVIDWLDTGFKAGSLMGIEIQKQTGRLYLVDALANRVFFIEEKP